MFARLVPILTSLLALTFVPPLVGCTCGPTGEADHDVALVELASGVDRFELAATIHIRDGSPEVEAHIADCASTPFAGATVDFFDSAGNALEGVGSGECTETVRISGAPGADVDLRVVVTLPAARTTPGMGEVDLVTFQDVCASVGASDIVSFGG